ncbi:putative membrane protein [Parabacteroides distasonis str. 3999B T(B) 6]|nr:putative membrane protein [Parabacteroides distasonis str. 3999B T(B) 4]KDS65784.1 putative membrane protein [Parabacteroides distasonis str. 3999B T(B) 6]KDS70066.1 putative membrane protein [Parabacteroides distasonis str. 3999B T(B) 6]
MYNISLCVIFILLCFYLGWHKRYKAIIENYERRLHSGNLLIIIIYMFLSLFLFVVLSFWKKSVI